MPSVCGCPATSWPAGLIIGARLSSYFRRGSVALSSLELFHPPVSHEVRVGGEFPAAEDIKNKPPSCPRKSRKYKYPRLVQTAAVGESTVIVSG